MTDTRMLLHGLLAGAIIGTTLMLAGYRALDTAQGAHNWTTHPHLQRTND